MGVLWGGAGRLLEAGPQRSAISSLVHHRVGFRQASAGVLFSSSPSGSVPQELWGYMLSRFCGRAVQAPNV
eukprot:517261-Alexandrium_andersonii.AAC.1